MPDIIQQLLDLKEWSQNPERYERRMNFRGAGLVQPGPGRQGYGGPGSGRFTKPVYGAKAMTEGQAEHIRKTLPEGVTLHWRSEPDMLAKGAWRVTATIKKGGEIPFNEAIQNPTKQQIKNLVKRYKIQHKIEYPNSIGYDKFEQLRLQKNNIKLSDHAFAEKLNREYKKTTIRDKPFNFDLVQKYQQKLDIVNEVGDWKSISNKVQKRLKDAFPQYEKMLFHNTKASGILKNIDLE